MVLSCFFFYYSSFKIKKKQFRGGFVILLFVNFHKICMKTKKWSETRWASFLAHWNSHFKKQIVKDVDIKIYWSYSLLVIIGKSKSWVNNNFIPLFLIKCVFSYTGWARLIRSHSSARFSFELSGNSNYIIHCNSNYVQNFELEINSI